MNVRGQQKDIKDYLHQSEVQARIKKAMHEAQSNAIVTISEAARLSGFSVNQLRDWEGEERGLLQSLRDKDGKTRRYSPAELGKLAIIHELLDKGEYSLADIPRNLSDIWTQVAGHQDTLASQSVYSKPETPASSHKAPRFIDKRAEENEKQEFWRYFAEQALRISLSVICQDIPDSLGGLILPLQDRKVAGLITKTEDLPKAGPSLVGWLERNRSFHTVFTEAPQFEYPSDFRLETLQLPGQIVSEGDRVLDNALVVLQRRARPLKLTGELVETVRRILHLLYQRVETWEPYFTSGIPDGLYQVHDLERASGGVGDRAFNSLLERVLELGEQTDGQKRWNFCTLLLPNDPNLPLQRQILVVRAQTENSPYKMGMPAVDPTSTDSLSLKAFQSGQIVYFAEILPGESMTTYQLPAVLPRYASNTVTNALVERHTRSALSLPINGNNGASAAVLYIASDIPHAFSIEDQRVLRFIGRMIEELLLTSQARRFINSESGNLIETPWVVDATFGEFASETTFIAEIEDLLRVLQQKERELITEEESLSIISVDIDDQSRIARNYSNKIAKNLSQQMGFHIRGHIQSLDKYASGKLFHISADKYYLLLTGISLDETRKLAKQLQRALLVDYRLNPSPTIPGHSVQQEHLLEIPKVTAHLGISWYKMLKLKEVLGRHNPAIAVQKARALIVAAIEKTLDEGKSRGGNCIITWDDKTWGYQKLD